MAWIKTVRMEEAGEDLKEAFKAQAKLYPPEYAVRVEAAEQLNKDGGPGILASHSLLPQTLYHAFSTYGTLLSPELPLSRRQHEMIAATVSVLNDCFY
ncbi:MAG TPA: hypothetical protein VFA07_02490 [Chthonomonadaceae bacterium]|nr:hypothetical protein [Chthonomonadaceae bacterium]